VPSAFSADDSLAQTLSVAHAADAMDQLQPLEAARATWLVPLAAGWRVLIICSLLGAALGYGWSLRAGPETYTAEVLIVPRVARTDVQFEPTIRTVTDVTSSPSGVASVISPERRQALVDLILGGSIERGAAQQLATVLPARELAPGVLSSHVRAGIKPRSEVIFIDASDTNAADAVAIANAWADVYVTHTNTLYADAVAGATLADLVAARDAAKRQLDAAEVALANDYSSNHLDEIADSLADRERQLNLLVDPTDAVSRGSQNPRAATNDYRLVELRTLDDLAESLQRLDTVSQSVKGLLSDSPAAADASGVPALALIKVQLVAITAALPSGLQLQLPIPNTATVTATDLQRLQSSLAQARQAVAQELEQHRAAYEADRQQRMQALNAELQQLRRDLEAAKASRQALQNARDLAQDTYAALARKAEEVKVAQADAGQEIQVASHATAATPAPTLSKALWVVIGAVAAFACAVAALLIRAGVRGWQPVLDEAGLAESAT
jgi:uncharacterized protein involved in exopolysaccharide biosynthesis